MLKICFKCREEKDISEFYSHPATADKHLGKCKECTKNDAKVGNVPRKCVECGKDFMAVAHEVTRRGGGAKTCSRECFYKYQPRLLAEKNKDMVMTYGSVHEWIKRVSGRPSLCEDCGCTEGTFDWANKSGKYLRNKDDWIRLCRKCHIKLDGTVEKRKTTLINKHGSTDIVSRGENGQYIPFLSIEADYHKRSTEQGKILDYIRRD